VLVKSLAVNLWPKYSDCKSCYTVKISEDSRDLVENVLDVFSSEKVDPKQQLSKPDIDRILMELGPKLFRKLFNDEAILNFLNDAFRLSKSDNNQGSRN
jgi:hypothetical protein